MTPDLTDSVAIVTGASSGIGRAIAQKFATAGADVVVADVRETPREGGTPTHERIDRDTDRRATYVKCDVTEMDDLAATMDAADAFGGVDVLVNNAGIFRSESFFEVTQESYRRLMDVNVTGPFFASQLAVRRMLGRTDENGSPPSATADSAPVRGAIVNVSSIAGLVGNGNYVPYCVSKGALRLLTYSMADALGPHGIRVNAIHPGGIETAMLDDAGMGPAERDAFIGSVPIGRLGEPAEIADVACLLASEETSYVTGESVVVDGGYIHTS